MNIPALQPLANVVVENQYQHIHAPGIVANATITVNDMTASCFEMVMRFALYLFYATVTLQEVMDALIRCSAVFKARADQVYKPHGETKNTAMETNARVAILNMNMTSMHKIQTDLNNLRAKVEANDRSRITPMFEPSFDGRYILPLVKEVDGFGPGLPGYPIDANDLPPNAPFSAGSVVPIGIFPTIDEIATLSHERLSLLSAVYNDDFDIIATDDLETRRSKFVDFIA